MHIFIDESGTFTPNGTSAPTISAVGALSVPSSLRAGARTQVGEASARSSPGPGRGEGAPPRRAASLGSHHAAGAPPSALRGHRDRHGAAPARIVADHKARQAERMTANLTSRHSPQIRGQLLALQRELEAMSNQLYVQSTQTFDVWRDLPRLMVHRRQQYVHVSVFDRVIVPRHRSYFTVLRHFESGGKSMVAPRFG